MKILTIFGTRPEYIRLNILINKLDKTVGRKNHTLVDTQQNYDKSLRDYFYYNFKIRKPDFFLNAKGTFAKQISIIFENLEKIILKIKPDKFLVLGDTNSSTAAFIAKRLGVEVFHIEAGNRSFNINSPEEVNRKLIDHLSDVHMCYSSRSKENLLKEGIHPKNIFVVGNPISEVIFKNIDTIEKSLILKKLKISCNQYFLATLHRQENVDDYDNLKNILDGFSRVALNSKKKFFLIVHPRLKKSINKFKINIKNLILIKPLNFYDFAFAQKNAECIFTDSGTVQEECSIFNKKCIVTRESTERLETVECSNIIVSGIKSNFIFESYKLITKISGAYEPPLDYQIINFSDRAQNIILSQKPI